ncbi:MoxR family ATPase [Myxococcota bacterium]|nr:MoxR family ATPase [Myxococcota bacterium]
MTQPTHTQPTPTDPQTALRDILASIRRVVLTQGEGVELTVLGILSGGHVLLEDVPGVGKTTLAKTLAKSLHLDFARVQFTPDLLPSDILGSTILNPKDSTFHFHQGPVFHHLLLADEINRASPRTQSALLEAMNERQVTIDGTTHPLPSPFFVIATQNPVDHQGTYPLPEAQLDRFIVRISLGYPSKEDEIKMLFDRQTTDPLDHIQPVMGLDTLRALQQQVRDIRVERDVALYLHAIVEATRQHTELALGASPRATLSFFRAIQARAFLQDRSYASPDDIQALTIPVLAHRIRLSNQARYGGKTTAHVLQSILATQKVPT